MSEDKLIAGERVMFVWEMGLCNYCLVISSGEAACQALEDPKIREMADIFGDTVAHFAVKYHKSAALRALEDPEIRELTKGLGYTVAHCAVQYHEDAALKAWAIVRAEHDTTLLTALADEKPAWLLEQLQNLDEPLSPDLLTALLTHENRDLRQAALLASAREPDRTTTTSPDRVHTPGR